MACSNNLAKWMRVQAESTAELLYCHTTNAWALQKIIAQGLEPTLCTVFNKNILYAFYGRPAYRRAADPLNTTGKAPVVIIIKPEALEQYIDRVFPFDSGAFPSRYKHWLAPGMVLEDFELDAVRNSPVKHVSSMFLTNENYFRCECCTKPLATGAEMELETLCQIYKDTNPTSEIDDRKHSVEIQVTGHIPLSNSTIEAIILPKQCLDYDFVKQFSNGCGSGVKLLDYELNKHKSSKEYQALLEDRAKDLQKALLLI